MRPAFTTLDRYLLKQVAGTFASVFAIVIALMTFEHLPRLFDIVRLSGRKGYIVVQSMIALVPEYASVGLLFGLYLAIALTVRRLALRGELDVVEAAGIPARRWLRFPALLTLLIAALLLWNQGWLMPAGEKRLSEIGRNMEDGRFGYDLEAGKFTDLGNGVTVRFESVDRATNELSGVFFRTPDTTFSASRGRLGFDFGNHVLVDLEDGRTVKDKNETLSFSHFHFDSGGRASTSDKDVNAAERRKGEALTALLASDDQGDRAAGWSRLMWPAFALVIPLLAIVLGRPLRRTSSSLGLMTGLVLLVVFTRTTGFVTTTSASRPSLIALGIGAAWLVAIGLIRFGQHRWGVGYVDGWLLRAGRRVGRQARRLGRSAVGNRDGSPGVAAAAA